MTEPDSGGAQPDPDQMDWDRDQHGKMEDHASDDEPATEPYEDDDA